MQENPLASDGESKLLWLFLVWGLPGLIVLAFWLNGFIGG
jgi:hypothetical protein